MNAAYHTVFLRLACSICIGDLLKTYKHEVLTFLTISSVGPWLIILCVQEVVCYLR